MAAILWRARTDFWRECSNKMRARKGEKIKIILFFFFFLACSCLHLYGGCELAQSGTHDCTMVHTHTFAIISLKFKVSWCSHFMDFFTCTPTTRVYPQPVGTHNPFGPRTHSHHRLFKIQRLVVLPVHGFPSVRAHSCAPTSLYLFHFAF